MNEENTPKKYGFVKFILVILILLLLAIIGFAVYNELAKSSPVNNVYDTASTLSNYYYTEDMAKDEYDKYFNEFAVKNIKLSNISKDAINKYNIEEKSLLNRIDKSVEIIKTGNDYKEKSFTPVNSIRSNINAELSKGVLSIKNCLIDDVTKTEDGDLNENLFTFNYEIKTEKILSSTELLSFYGLSKDDVAASLFDQYIFVEDTRNDIVYIDNETLSKVDAKYINNNKEKYVKLISSKLDDFAYFYIFDSNLFVTYKISDVLESCFWVTGDSVEKYSIMKLK